MNEILAPLLSYVLLYKYVAVFAVIYVSAVIVPLPANAMLLAVGAFASQGYFHFWIVLPVAVIANTLGDLTDYGAARYYGVLVIRMLHLHKFRFFEQIQEELRTDAAITVFITRFAGSLSTISNFLAGLAAVPFGTFFFYDLLGNFIEPGVALSIGYLVGNYWSDFSNIFSLTAGIAAASIVLFVLVRIYRRITRRYNGSNAQA